MLRASKRRGLEEGAAAVETAIALSVLLLLILGIIEFGTALYSWNTMQLAVQQAGRNVMVKYAGGGSCDTTCAETQMQSVLTSASSCTTPTAGQICVNATTATGTTPPTMTLTAAYNFNLVALIPSFTMTSQTVVPLD